MVYLLGAGPGDPCLLTVKGKEILQMADTIIYDALVSQDILRLVNENAKKIYVGKIGGNHAVPQEEINEIILKEGLINQTVVRLKGGDSFLFGRGGEELELLSLNNVPFEVIPGITSALSVPAYAGIPVTHRDFVSSLHIITGHTKKGCGSNIDFDSLVKLDGTLVFLMGISSLSLICKGLKDAKMPLNMPCAIIENGTRVNQKTLISTLEHLENDAKLQDVKSPAIIVFGKVCSLADKFSWFNPLKKRVLIARPQGTTSKFSKKLINSGFDVLEIPTTEIKKLDFSLDFDTLKNYDTLAFTSANGVKIFFDRLKELNLDIRILHDKKFAVVGNMTANELKNYGIFADFIPDKFCGKELSKIIPECSRVLIFRAKTGAVDLPLGLNDRNISFLDLPIYETVFLKAPEALINDAKSSLDAICFTSASSVKGFANSIPLVDFKDKLTVCIGEMTANESKLQGFTNILMSDKATTDSLLDKLMEVFYDN